MADDHEQEILAAGPRGSSGRSRSRGAEARRDETTWAGPRRRLARPRRARARRSRTDYGIQIADDEAQGRSRRSATPSRSSVDRAEQEGEPRLMAPARSSSPAAGSSPRSARARTRSSTRSTSAAPGSRTARRRARSSTPRSAMTPKEARRADRFTQLAVAAAEQAAAEAGLPDGVEPERLGVLIGTGVGGLETLERECTNWLEGGDRARLAAVRADDDAQRRRGHDRDAPGRPRAPGSRSPRRARRAPTRSARRRG